MLAHEFLPDACSVASGSGSLQPHELQLTRLLRPWNSPGKNTGMGCHTLLQGIFPTEGSNPHLMHWQAESLPVSHQGGSPLSTRWSNWVELICTASSKCSQFAQWLICINCRPVTAYHPGWISLPGHTSLGYLVSLCREDPHLNLTWKNRPGVDSSPAEPGDAVTNDQYSKWLR